MLGEVKPGAEAVVRMLSRHVIISVKPTGDLALNRLGLHEQLPTSRDHITYGPVRKFTQGKLRFNVKEDNTQ